MQANFHFHCDYLLRERRLYAKWVSGSLAAVPIAEWGNSGRHSARIKICPPPYPQRASPPDTPCLALEISIYPQAKIECQALIFSTPDQPSPQRDDHREYTPLCLQHGVPFQQACRCAGLGGTCYYYRWAHKQFQPRVEFLLTLSKVASLLSEVSCLAMTRMYSICHKSANHH